MESIATALSMGDRWQWANQHLVERDFVYPVQRRPIPSTGFGSLLKSGSTRKPLLLSRLEISQQHTRFYRSAVATRRAKRRGCASNALHAGFASAGNASARRLSATSASSFSRIALA